MEDIEAGIAGSAVEDIEAGIAGSADAISEAAKNPRPGRDVLRDAAALAAILKDVTVELLKRLRVAPLSTDEARRSVMTTDEDRAEAVHLALLPRRLQREAVAMIGSPAADPKVPAADREEARRRSRVLERVLGLTPRKK